MENLRNIYESGLARTLAERFPGATIILFGSYSFGEDTTESDVDITVIGYNPKRIDLQDIETILERKIHLNFFKTIGDIEKNLKENILNGMILSGGITL